MTIADYNGNLPENIRRIINEKGLKQGAIAKRAGLTDNQMTAIITGRRLIKVSEITAIAEALGVEIADIYAASGKNKSA